MFNRSAIFAIAASAVIGLAVFSSSDADARRGGHGGHGGGHHGHSHGGHGHGGHNHRPHRPHVHHHGRHHHHHHHHHRRHWHPRVIYRTYGHHVNYSRPVAGPCTCLRKTYLPNGAVMFRDVCTNESAVSGPAHS